MTTKLDREKMAGSVYDKQYFTDDEMKQYQAAVDAASAGKTDWGSAHTLAQQLRARYGYSGGEDGSRYVKLADAGERGEKFTYADAPTYTRKRSGQIQALTDAVLGRRPFSYDAEKDPLYQQYRDSYTRQGRQAMEDTLGKVSARTGGLASSYAGQAAQQTYDQYMSALADKIPELRQLAWQMYQDEGNRQMQNISLLRALDEDERQDYLTALGQYNADRNFAYGQYADDRNYDYRLARDQKADEWQQKQWDYNAGRDQKADEWKQKEWDYSVGRDQIADGRWQTQWDHSVAQEERKAAETKAATLAAAGDFSGYEALGYPPEQIAGLKKAWQEAKTAAKSSGGGYRGGSGGGGNDLMGVLDKMASFGDDNKALLYLYGLGLSNDKSDTIWKMYQESKNGAGPEAPTGTVGVPASPIQTTSELNAKFGSGYQDAVNRVIVRGGMAEEEVLEYLQGLADRGQLTAAGVNSLLDRLGY